MRVDLPSGQPRAVVADVRRHKARPFMFILYVMHPLARRFGATSVCRDCEDLRAVYSAHIIASLNWKSLMLLRENDYMLATTQLDHMQMSRSLLVARNSYSSATST